MTEINAEKLKRKKAHFILIARDVFVALAVVVAKAPHIYESDSSILILLQIRMIKCGKVSRHVGEIGFTTKHCEFTIAKKLEFTANFTCYFSHRISVLFRLRRDFVIRKLVRKQEIDIHAALQRFRKIWRLNQSEVQCSRDNRKVSTFLHSDVFIGFGSFLPIWTVNLKWSNQKKQPTKTQMQF